MPENEVVVLIDERELVDDEYVKRVVALAVPESGKFPDGIKYRMHYGTLSGDTVLRYDSSHGTHECHSGGTVQEIPFPGLELLYRRFVRQIEDRRPSEEKP